jgi:phosphoribosyl-ATP pyrophosphohydrolase/phosphoribosyl-AMP cyclohydrolase/histidinol dehydrogenase
MAEHVLISLDLEDVQSSRWQGLDWDTISILGRVSIDVSPKNYDIAAEFLRKYVNVRVYCNVVALSSVWDVVSLLDKGAAKLFVSQSQMKEIMDKGVVEDTDRLILYLDGSHVPHSAVGAIQQDLQAMSGKLMQHFRVPDVDDSDLRDLMTNVQKATPGALTRYVTLAQSSLAEYVVATNTGFVPIVPANVLTSQPDDHPNLMPVHALITANLRSDRPDGLFPTVVTDEHGVCLGLVYSNEQSIATALRLRRGVYHSRSRNGLWIKGEESGNVQELISIEWDCDADALRFMVRQRGDGKSMLKRA